MESFNTALRALGKLTDEELASLSFSLPWQYDYNASLESQSADEDGFPLQRTVKRTTDASRKELQIECWNKFHENPQVNTSVRGLVGRLTGFGFEISSDNSEVQNAIDETEFDWRNRLYTFWPKFVGRAMIEGELFLCLTLHQNGFVEVDFIDPALVDSSEVAGGVVVHPFKTTLPLMYCIKDIKGVEYHIPSIYIAHDVNLLKEVNIEKLNLLGSTEGKFKALKGMSKFIVSWDRSFISTRNTSYLRTTIEWLNYYVNLKKYEIDHKKSSGAYLWVVNIEDPKTFRLWLSLSEEQKRETGIMAKKTPGGTLILPPGMKITAINPQLPKISEGDTDIMHMITSGLNEPEDVSTGQSKGTFASVKASRGPMSDRISDEVVSFERFLQYDFYGAIFLLKNKVGKMPEFFKVRKAVDFKNEKPIFENVKVKPENLVNISFPVSEVIEAESRARAYLGVKHGSVYDTLGIPNAEIAKKLGFGGYKKLRLEQATEDEMYPELIPTLDAEAVQENKIEPGKKGVVKPVEKKTKQESK